MSLTNDTGTTMLVQPATSCYGGNGGFGNMFGGDGGWFWIVILFLFCFNGWGNGWGNGNGGMNGGVGSEVQRGFDHSSVVTKLDGITQGICNLGYDQLAQMNGINTNILQTGFGIQQALNNVSTANMQTANAMTSQIANCCCETQRQIERGFCDTNYNLATNTSNIIQNAHSDADRVIAKLDAMESARQQERISALQYENQSLRFQASQTAQNGFIDAVGNSIVAQLRQPTPMPAYVVPNPNCCSPCNNCY